jgi:hypothetical protein
LIIDVEGQKIESSWETLTNSASLDSIYFEPETRATSDKDINETGLQFYADSQGEDEDPRYCRFEWNETLGIGLSWSINLGSILKFFTA